MWEGETESGCVRHVCVSLWKSADTCVHVRAMMGFQAQGVDWVGLNVSTLNPRNTHLLAKKGSQIGPHSPQRFRCGRQRTPLMQLQTSDKPRTCSTIVHFVVKSSWTLHIWQRLTQTTQRSKQRTRSEKPLCGLNDLHLPRNTRCAAARPAPQVVQGDK